VIQQQQEKKRRVGEHGRQADSTVVSPINSLPDDGPCEAEIRRTYDIN
jgi:hypothetical protein